jgi:hypothetical protein
MLKLARTSKHPATRLKGTSNNVGSRRDGN